MSFTIFFCCCCSVSEITLLLFVVEDEEEEEEEVLPNLGLLCTGNFLGLLPGKPLPVPPIPPLDEDDCLASIRTQGVTTNWDHRKGCEFLEIFHFSYINFFYANNTILRSLENIFKYLQKSCTLIKSHVQRQF